MRRVIREAQRVYNKYGELLEGEADISELIRLAKIGAEYEAKTQPKQRRTKK